MKNKLPPCFAFKNSGKHPRKDEIKKRFNEVQTNKVIINDEYTDIYYGRTSNGRFDWYRYIGSFGEGVVEITEDDFLAMTEPELTKLPDNFYFQYVDENDREVLKERLGRGSDFSCINSYYGNVEGSRIYQSYDKSSFPNATEITQQDFIRLTEPEKKVEPEIVTEHLPKPELTPLTGQIIEISERGILIELTKEQIKEFKIFEVVTIK